MWDSTASAFGYDDPVAPAKILSDFAQEHKELELKVKVLEGKVIDAEALNDLACQIRKLLAMLLGRYAGPIGGFARVLAGPITGFL